MQENKFEDQVQKIMDQLSFDPNDRVWTGVEKEIGKDKKRRKPLFWIFFISGTLLFGLGYLYVSNKSSVNIFTSKTKAQLDTLLMNKSIAESGRGTELQKTPETGSVPKSAVSASVTIKQQRGFNHFISKNEFSRSEKNTGIKSSSDKRNDQTGILPDGLRAEYAENLSVTAGATILSASGSGKREESIISMTNDSGALGKALTTTKPNSLNADSGVSVPPIKIREKKISPWKLGFSGTLGFSDLTKSTTNSAYYNAPANSATGGASYAPPYNSTVKNGFSYSAGGFISRIFSERISVSAGMNYRYNSTKVEIGNTSSGSFTSFYAQVADSRGSHSYTNQYHYLEIPVLADLTLNKNKKLPLIWQGGFSFSYLINSNALYFNPSTNLYYKDIQNFNRAQWNALTAIMIGLNMQKSQMLIGPQLQYGLTNLNKPGVYSQHFISYGLKVSFIPNRN